MIKKSQRIIAFINQKLTKIYFQFLKLTARYRSFKCFDCRKIMVHKLKNLYYCPTCNLFQFRPQPSKLLWKLLHFQKLLSAYHSNDKLKRAHVVKNRDLDFIEKYAQKGRLFDVGTNGGLLLELAKQRGWIVEGNELSLRAIKWAKKNFNIDIYWNYFSNLNLPKENYDVIVFWNVLEHTHNPYLVLKKAHSLLKKEGIIAILIPTKKASQIRKSYLTGHLFEFQEKGIKAYLKKSGFTMVFEESKPLTSYQRTTLIYKKG